ncbi:glycosyltransferase [uncultured Nitrospira sp.]|uniref:glycosyltransferase n=1 Tax=uncultured Nitrospira sp. TaxID=157176 RepID=UPI003140BA9B
MNEISQDDKGQKVSGTLRSSIQGITISIIVPVYNGGEAFRQCLISLAALQPPPMEIIVVSDGDTDGSWQMAKEFNAQVIRLPTTSGGPAQPRNIGALQAKGEYLFFVDADVRVHPDSLRQVAEAFHHDPDLTALIGSYDDAPAETNFLSQYKNLIHHYVHQHAQKEASTFWGACGAIRREAFLEIGGFDENYRRPSIEDIELGYRLKKAGHKIQLCKDIHVKHLKRWGIRSMLKADFFYRAIPWTELILRDRRFTNDLNIRHTERLCVVLTYGLVGALIGAIWWVPLLAVAGLIMVSLVIINAPLYRFFLNKRGIRFAVQSVPWHWLYYLYSGLAFAIGLARHIFCGGNRKGSTKPALALESFDQIRKSGRQ